MYYTIVSGCCQESYFVSSERDKQGGSAIQQKKGVVSLKYTSTRDEAKSVSAAQAISQGISGEGGLFVPCELPHYSYDDLTELSKCSYEERAVRILKDFLTDFSETEIRECVVNAYGGNKFSGGHPAPLTLQQNGELNMYMLELWHGPTCAFKDMALQILPHLLTKSLEKIHSDKTAVILVATSGDTGKAALEGFKDVDGTRVLVFYPENGVSPMQKLQMNTQEGSNVAVCAIEGNFDDAQTGVKKIFTNEAVRAQLEARNMMFSSANSINWGRLLPQIVYHISAYCDLMATGEMDYEGEEINIVVPTGNFGNILAAYYAKQMGLPVHKLICASNANNVLTDFLRTGVYDRNRPFHTTISPSMDILVSSNLERLLYHLTNGNSQKVSEWMQQLSETGRYEVDEDIKRTLQELFWAGFCDDEATKNTVHEMFSVENYLIDPHTAVAANVYKQYVGNTGDVKTPTVVVSTASPYKFPGDVLSAVTGEEQPGDEFQQIMQLAFITGTPVPPPIGELQGKEIRFENHCRPDGMTEAVLAMVR